ncbi:DUF6492 family protein [Devosia psychrophila]|uniref:Glycosyl transferase family 8 n=1 Tax=Devosia psychrophila TaxID=728005 RepID=A0A0F5PZJ2_9HYPH|nr:DUF6492 family protein [Devosia psychrophila]KKC33821.1 hypothetical protein WH91_06740 [Devosia psychrophila]SFD37765.1 hypothetical protein SAMN04488059_1483 [Devosia psychrophila]
MPRSISLITPSYSADFEACRLLCNSMDRFVTGHDMHFIVVGDEDAALFSALAGRRRRIICHSDLLPKFLPVGRWNGRRYWWAGGVSLPVYGWHLQQLRKIAMTLAQSSERIMCIDSDNCFCRPFDMRLVAEASRLPHFVAPADIAATFSSHVTWLKNAHALLGLPTPEFPADDFIGQMIVWERETVRQMTQRIESTADQSWWKALVRIRQFSEYLIYGVAVANDPPLALRHHRVTQSDCLTYWSGPQLDAAALANFIATLAPHQHAIAIQSHTNTPIDLIRRVVLENA